MCLSHLQCCAGVGLVKHRVAAKKVARAHLSLFRTSTHQNSQRLRCLCMRTTCVHAHVLQVCAYKHACVCARAHAPVHMCACVCTHARGHACVCLCAGNGTCVVHNVYVYKPTAVTLEKSLLAKTTGPQSSLSCLRSTS